MLPITSMFMSCERHSMPCVMSKSLPRLTVCQGGAGAQEGADTAEDGAHEDCLVERAHGVLHFERMGSATGEDVVDAAQAAVSRVGEAPVGRREAPRVVRGRPEPAAARPPTRAAG